MLSVEYNYVYVREWYFLTVFEVLIIFVRCCHFGNRTAITETYAATVRTRIRLETR